MLAVQYDAWLSQAFGHPAVPEYQTALAASSWSGDENCSCRRRLWIYWLAPG